MIKKILKTVCHIVSPFVIGGCLFYLALTVISPPTVKQNSDSLRIATYPHPSGDIQELTTAHLFSRFLLIGKGNKEIDSIIIYISDTKSGYRINLLASQAKKIPSFCTNKIIGSSSYLSDKDTTILAEVSSDKLMERIIEIQSLSSITLWARVNGEWLASTMHYQW